LSVDGTNWKFRQANTNIVIHVFVYEGVAFPLLSAILDKRRNSNSQERIDLFNRFICLFGEEVIESLVADREFVGEKWLVF
jgi:hypothetical protein